MNIIYGRDGNVYKTSISNGKEYMSSKKEKEEFAIAELEKIKDEMNVELFEEYSAEREFDRGYESCLKQQINRIDNHIKELKGENK